EAFASGRLPPEMSLLVVPDASRLPASVAEPLQRWVRSRKAVLFVSEEPPLRTWLYRAGERWVERQEALRALASWRLLWREHPAPERWRRSTGGELESAWSLVDTPYGKGYRLQVSQLLGWCTYDLPIAQPFRNGETLMRFWAKGDKNTRALSIEWRERDGSRWVATVPLSEEWKQYVLEPTDFRYWHDNPSQGRGGPGDYLKPENAAEISIGLAHSFGSYPADTPLEAVIAGVQVGRLGQDLPSPLTLKLEGISPWYKFYQDSRGQWRSVMRHRGVGIGGQSPGRRIVMPLGERACLFVSAKGETEGSLWAWLPLSGATPQNLTSVLRPMLRGWHLLRAGTEQFGYWQEQRVRCGAEIANWRGEPVTLRLTAQLSSARKPARSERVSVRLQPGERRRLLFPDTALQEGEWRVKVTAEATDGTRDELEHSFHVIGKPAAMPLIRVRGGRFLQGDKPFYAHGVNFWPLWIAGQEPDEYWGHWLGPEQYDPQEIERALRIANEVGLNVLSIQYTNLSHAPQLVDFLERARRYGMYVNLFITAAHPFGFDPELLRQLIEAARIPRWDNIFAYDIAWEPVWGNHAERKRFDLAWREWIVEQYGSIENAERDWGYSLPREGGEVTNPTDEQILNDGEWRRMVAAYRRFLEDHTNRAYWRVVKFIRTLDSRHLIGVRTGWGGTGSLWADWRMPFDLLAGAPFFDFISPEGYSLTESWQNFRAGGFITAYARWAGGGKPVFWAEFGATIYPDTTPQRIAYQRDVWEWTYRMIEESRADGSAGWWFPGGYRTTENSDYGIIHPDGTLRPAAQVARQWASRLARLPSLPDPRDVHVITFDRDLHPRGFSQVWMRHRDEYLRAVEAGKRVELRTEGTGTTSENVPLVAVGNTPCNGSNPPKYLNAQILRVEAIGTEGKATELEPDQPVPPDTVRLRVTVINTGEATWVRPGKRRVELATSWGERKVIEQSVARYATTVLEVPFVATRLGAHDQPATLRLQLVTEDGKVIPFGER
ncbi:MAG: hypothetical protein RMK92_11290, partial [Armatimonadota bacterium]|nr:hypothetical protein [Armatimonadota bacterium]